MKTKLVKFVISGKIKTFFYCWNLRAIMAKSSQLDQSCKTMFIFQFFVGSLLFKRLHLSVELEIRTAFIVLINLVDLLPVHQYSIGIWSINFVRKHNTAKTGVCFTFHSLRIFFGISA